MYLFNKFLYYVEGTSSAEFFQGLVMKSFGFYLLVVLTFETRKAVLNGPWLALETKLHWNISTWEVKGSVWTKENGLLVEWGRESEGVRVVRRYTSKWCVGGSGKKLSDGSFVWYFSFLICFFLSFTLGSFWFGTVIFSAYFKCPFNVVMQGGGLPCKAISSIRRCSL